MEYLVAFSDLIKSDQIREHLSSNGQFDLQPYALSFDCLRQ